MGPSNRTLPHTHTNTLLRPQPSDTPLSHLPCHSGRTGGEGAHRVPEPVVAESPFYQDQEHLIHGCMRYLQLVVRGRLLTLQRVNAPHVGLKRDPP